MKGCVGIVRIILEHGDDADAKTNDATDALYWACQREKWDVAELSVLNGANPEV